MAEPAALEALLGRVALGERAAFEQLYRQTADRLFGICVRVLNDRTEAEDVLQEVYAGIWHRAAQFDANRAAAMGWLGTMTRNRAIDRLRERATARTVAGLELVAEVPDPGPSPVQEAERSSDRQRLERCFGELDGQRQGLIRDAFFGGFTYEELASRIKAPLGSVKSWIRRGLMQLRTCLES